MVGVGCRRAPPPGAKAAAATTTASETTGQPAAGTTASAQRCGECHNPMHEEWTPSAHARAASSPAFVAMRGHATKRGAEMAAECDRCHAPLRALDARDPAADEGVTCDVCHTIRAVEPRRTGAGFTMVTNDNTRMGPLCDARDHYFHRMGCSPLHGEARFCAGCHLYYRKTASGEVPIYTEYEEWLASPYPDLEQGCQDCHMPGSRGEVARGSPARESVPHHGFLGSDGLLRRRAMTLKLDVAERDGELQVTVHLANKRGGHRVPTGLPERRLVLRVRSFDEAGAEVARVEKAYGRVLGDARGQPAPSFSAVRVLEDSRFQPRETRSESFAIEGPRTGEVRAELVYQELAPEIAGALGIPSPPEQVLLAARVPFEAASWSRRRRTGLPATQVAKVNGS